MAILDLQQESDHAIRRQRFDEVPLGLGEPARVRIAVGLCVAKLVSGVRDSDQEVRSTHLYEIVHQSHIP